MSFKIIKRRIIEIVIAFLLNAVLGISLLLEGNVLPEYGYLTKILALLMLYIFIIEIFYFLLCYCINFENVGFAIFKCFFGSRIS